MELYNPSTKLNVIDTMNDLGFFNNNFKLIDERCI